MWTHLQYGNGATAAGGEPTEPHKPGENCKACYKAGSLIEDAWIIAPSLKMRAYCRRCCFYSAWMRAPLLCVCVLFCMACAALTSVHRRGACQNMFYSPRSWGIGDVHSWLTVSLVFKSQWDIGKLCTARAALVQRTGWFYCTVLSSVLLSHPHSLVTLPLLHL